MPKVFIHHDALDEPENKPYLFGRRHELETLDEAWTNPGIHLLNLHAFEGMGKTTLLRCWLELLQERGWHDAEAVYAWSFFPPAPGQNPRNDMDEFLLYALGWFGEHRAETLTALEKVKRLAGLIQERHTLLILDGLDSLQYASGMLEGGLADMRLQLLLEQLVAHNPGLCVAVTAKPLGGEFVSSEAVQHLELPVLTADAAVRILRRHEVQGADRQLLRAVEDYGFHPLTLQLLGGYLRRWQAGDIRKLDQIPIWLDSNTEGLQLRRLLSAYETGFAGMPELTLLYLLSLFERPVSLPELQSLYKPGARQKLKGWLEGRMSLAWAGKSKELGSYASLTLLLPSAKQEKWRTLIHELAGLGLLETLGTTIRLPKAVQLFFTRQFHKHYPMAWKEACKQWQAHYVTEEIIPEHAVEAGEHDGFEPANSPADEDEEFEPANLPAAEDDEFLVNLTFPEFLATVDTPAPHLARQIKTSLPPLEPVAVPRILHSHAMDMRRWKSDRARVKRLQDMLKQVEVLELSMQTLQQQARQFQKCMRQLDNDLQYRHHSTPHHAPVRISDVSGSVPECLCADSTR